MATNLVSSREALMANKNKATKNSKKVAGRSLKEKRLDKKAKRTSQESAGNESVGKTFNH